MDSRFVTSAGLALSYNRRQRRRAAALQGKHLRVEISPGFHETIGMQVQWLAGFLVPGRKSPQRAKMGTRWGFV
jgi:hypothetical protein